MIGQLDMQQMLGRVGAKTRELPSTEPKQIHHSLTHRLRTVLIMSNKKLQGYAYDLRIRGP